MRYFGFLILSILLVAAQPALGQDNSCAKPGESGIEGLENLLREQKSCKAATALLRECRWGSSADTSFSAIVVSICEKEFYPQLSKADQIDYGDRMQLCAYRYASQQGTLYMSMAATCQSEVAARFADPNTAREPLGRASFNCGEADTALEKAICSDRKLGQADLVLAQGYGEAVASLKADPETRGALIADQRRWLDRVARKCDLVDGSRPFSAKSLVSAKSLACARGAFEKRFALLDGCGEAGISIDCLAETADGAADAADPGLRASFDCDKPSTPLEIAICADTDLGQADIRLAAIYENAKKTVAGEPDRKLLVESQRRWLAFVQGTCPLGAVGGIPPVLGRACVRSAFELRGKQLTACLSKPDIERKACLDDFRILEDKK
ncbi:lysozyme inhibitor LprI family protein [Labrys neptuniae]|uniref:lysozyme inhibitor LprI family protein n=1 Tax=Labrys neptuniae TaxID=376174 RepID=UPI00288E5816|nr:lysozyme inhibitor LprI family protein [Labrys neptuniae]MDT3378782.1 lysozyme inhibitor LprI family protein [Labrys neptuniae]